MIKLIFRLEKSKKLFASSQRLMQNFFIYLEWLKRIWMYYLVTRTRFLQFSI